MGARASCVDASASQEVTFEYLEMPRAASGGAAAVSGGVVLGRSGVRLAVALTRVGWRR